MRENLNVYENVYILMFTNIYMLSYLCYQCLNEKESSFLDFNYVEKI